MELYYSESFNTFGELGRSIKQTFVNEERAQRRKQRQAERRARREDRRNSEVVATEPDPQE